MLSWLWSGLSVVLCLSILPFTLLLHIRSSGACWCRLAPFCISDHNIPCVNSTQTFPRSLAHPSPRHTLSRVSWSASESVLAGMPSPQRWGLSRHSRRLRPLRPLGLFGWWGRSLSYFRSILVNSDGFLQNNSRFGSMISLFLIRAVRVRNFSTFSLNAIVDC